MKAKRQNRTLSVSATMLDGSGGHVKGLHLDHVAHPRHREGCRIFVTSSIF